MIPNGKHTKPTNGRAIGEDPAGTASFSGLAHDAIELAELQGKLLVLDVKTATRQAWMSLALCVVGACLLLGCIPVALLALTEWFTTAFEWSRTASLAAAAGIGLLLSAGTVAAAWLRLRDGLQSLQRSREELNRNLTWIKSNLKRVNPRSASDAR